MRKFVPDFQKRSRLEKRVKSAISALCSPWHLSPGSFLNWQGNVQSSRGTSTRGKLAGSGESRQMWQSLDHDCIWQRLIYLPSEKLPCIRKSYCLRLRHMYCIPTSLPKQQSLPLLPFLAPSCNYILSQQESSPLIETVNNVGLRCLLGLSALCSCSGFRCSLLLHYLPFYSLPQGPQG